MEDLTSVQSVDPENWDDILAAFLGDDDGDEFGVIVSEEDLPDLASTASNQENDHSSASREGGGDEPTWAD